MSFFLILTVVLLAAAAVLTVKRRSQRGASRSGRYRSPRAGLNLERQSGFAHRSRQFSRRSDPNSLAGPIFLALVVVVMVFWLVAAFFLPEGQTRSAMVSESRADASPPEQFPSLAGRLSTDGASSDGPGAMSQAATAVTGSSGQASGGAPLTEAAQTLTREADSHLGQVGLIPSRASAKAATPAKAKTASAKPAGTAKPAAQTKAADQAKSAAQAKPAAQTKAADQAKSAVQTKTPVTPAPSAGSGASMVSAASASSAPRAAAAGSRAPIIRTAVDQTSQSAEILPPPDEAALASSREFAVHLASFSDQANADAYRAKLAAAGESARVSQATIEGRQWFRVMSGQFGTRAAAEAHGKDLKRRGLTVDTGRYLIKALD